jgi:hypothetical protein
MPMISSDEKITFKDKNGSEIIIMEDFVFTEDIRQWVDYKISISYEYFKASTKLYCEVGDFDYLRIGLKALYDGGPKACHFIQNDASFGMTFSIDQFGIVNVNAELGVPSSKSKLDIFYQIDQSFIPDLIKQIDDILALAPPIIKTPSPK